MCAGGEVSGHSKTQKCVTLSTTQPEYVGMADAGKVGLFLREVDVFMLRKVGMPCMPTYMGNEGAIQIAKHPISTSNSKHIDLRHYFLGGLVERNEIDIIHVASQHQHADFPTKQGCHQARRYLRGISSFAGIM